MREVVLSGEHTTYAACSGPTGQASYGGREPAPYAQHTPVDFVFPLTRQLVLLLFSSLLHHPLLLVALRFGLTVGRAHGLVVRIVTVALLWHGDICRFAMTSIRVIRPAEHSLPDIANHITTELQHLRKKTPTQPFDTFPNRFTYPTSISDNSIPRSLPPPPPPLPPAGPAASHRHMSRTS